MYTYHFTNPHHFPRRKQSYTGSLELSLAKIATTNTIPKMSYGTNTAPTIDSHMLVQLLLCIGLPLVILPILAAVAYLGFRCFRARKSKPAGRDIEQGTGFVHNKTREVVEEEIGPVEDRHMMTPALVSNSVQVPVALGRNF